MSAASPTPAPGTLDVRLAQEGPIPLDVTLQCRPGELLALTGPSGSGKTSILRAIAGLLRPRDGHITCAGEVWFDARANTWLRPQARRVGLVFQDYALFPHLTASGNIALALDDREATSRQARALELLAKVNLEGLHARRPHELSGGQRQRVALARALARAPRVLLLDEPFSAVDQMTRGRLKRELVALRRTLQLPIVLVTHDLDEALALADTITVLHHGRTLQTATPEIIRLKPASPTVARLLGQGNVFSGVLARASTADLPGALIWGGLTLEVKDTGAWPPGAAVNWVIPSDHIVLHRRGRPSLGERQNPVSGSIGELALLGEQTAITMLVEGSADQTVNFTVATHTARRNELAPGAPIAVSLLAEGIHVFAQPRAGASA